jgi:hypothetical protein
VPQSAVARLELAQEPSSFASAREPVLAQVPELVQAPRPFHPNGTALRKPSR